MLNLTAEYALRAVLYLGRRDTTEAAKIEEISDALGAPRNYLSKTLNQLVRAGVLWSGRGPQGGFRLAVPPAELPLARVIEPFDSASLARRCLLGEGPCSDETPCAAHDRWKAIAVPMRRFFGETTVADLLVDRAGGAPSP